MTRTQSRLAELEAIRDRSLTDEEQAEVKRLAHLDRQCKRRRELYGADPAYRNMLVERSLSWRRNSGRHGSRAEASRIKALKRHRDAAGRFV